MEKYFAIELSEEEVERIARYHTAAVFFGTLYEAAQDDESRAQIEAVYQKVETERMLNADATIKACAEKLVEFDEYNEMCERLTETIKAFMESLQQETRH